MRTTDHENGLTDVTDVSACPTSPLPRLRGLLGFLSLRRGIEPSMPAIPTLAETMIGNNIEDKPCDDVQHRNAKLLCAVPLRLDRKSVV